MTAITMKRSKMVAALCVMFVVCCAACSRESTDVEQASTAGGSIPEQRPVAGLSVAMASDGERGVVVLGGDDFKGKLQPSIRLVGETIAQPLPIDTPLLNVEARWIGDEVLVTGNACPQWTDVNRPPTLGDEEDPAAVCGSQSIVAGMWNPSSVSWRQLDTGEQTIRFGLGAGSMSALVRTLGPDGWSLAVLDASSGSLTQIPELSSRTTGDPSSTVTYCHSDTGTTALAVWEDQPPIDYEQIRIDEADVVSATLFEDVEQKLLPLALEGGSWQSVSSDGDSVAAATTPVCTAEGLVVAAMGKAARVAIDGSGAAWNPLGALPIGSQVTVVSAAEGGGQALAIAPTPPPSAEDPDAARPTPIYVLDGSEWTDLGDASYSSGWSGAAWNGQLMQLVPVSSTTIELARQVVAP